MTTEQTTTPRPEVIALHNALEAQKKAEAEVIHARQEVRHAESREKTAFRAIGAAVRSLRIALGITAKTMAERHFINGNDSDLARYVKFEDEGEIDNSRRSQIIERLLRDAKAKD